MPGLWTPARPRLTWNGPYLQAPAVPISPVQQAARVNVPMRLATCEEVRCTWFLFGHEGQDPDENGIMAPFVHPAGVRCGDFKRCWHPNCPCPSRVRNHRVPDERYELIHRIATRQAVRTVTGDEWRYKVAEGFDRLWHIKTRGL